jgi:D-glycero-D-manno-heptose 1,7-bisphosphate phosphatase
MKVAFLDRDGVINVDTGYTWRIDEFQFTDGCVDALKTLRQAGYALVIVTNQSGIGRGYYSEQDYQQLTQWYLQQLQQLGVDVLGVYHCPHTPEDGCHCRKPEPGLLLQAAAEHNVTMKESLMIGDKLSDMEAARAAGVSSCYLIGESDAFDTYQGRMAENLSQCVKHYLM